MIIWLNGTFGIGKTTTAGALCDHRPLRLFDPEFVGYMVAAQLKDHEFSDFQQLAPWRALVPDVAKQIHDFTGTNLVAVQTVLRHDYWRELRDGLNAVDMPVFHVVLDCDTSELRRRIETDADEPQAREWRLDHIERFQASRQWMVEEADLVVDTTKMSPDEVAGVIWGQAVAGRQSSTG